MDEQWSKTVSELNINLWGWVRNHISAALDLEVPEVVTIPSGRLQSDTRGMFLRFKHREMAMPNTAFHPAFIRYFETPRAIKDLHEGLIGLSTRNRALYLYIVARGEGYSLEQIDELGLFPGHFLIDQHPNPAHANAASHTQFGRQINFLAISFLYSTLPEDVRGKFGNEETFRIYFEAPPNQGRSTPERYKRLTCPHCGGKNRRCSLCHTRYRKWDGTVPAYMYESYMRRIQSGQPWREHHED